MEEKLYLDSNIVERYFKRIYEAKKKGREFEIPKIFEFFRQRPEISLVVSSWTFAEVMEHMWKSYGFEGNEISFEVQKFIRDFGIFMIKEFNIEPKIMRWIRKFKLESKDSIHLLIASREGIPILTDDRQFAEKGSALHGFVTVSEFFLEFFPSNDFVK